MGEAFISAPITPIYTPFCVKNPEENPPFFYKEDFLGFFLKPFSGAITLAALITATLTTAIIITAVIATAIGSTFIRVKIFPFGETF